MIEPLSPHVLAGVRQSATLGAATAQVLLHLLERVAALEAAQQQPHQNKLDQLIALGRGNDEPTPEAAPKATLSNALISAEAADHSPAATEMDPSADPLVAEDELVRRYAQPVEQALQAGSGINGAAAAGLRALYDLGCQHGAAQPPGALPARVLAMCQKRGWSLHWTSRGAYLHLEASELIEALRGKRGRALAEAADVLLVLMSITENAGIPWAEVLSQTAATCARLEVCERYPGEERDAQPAPPTAPAGGLVERVAAVMHPNCPRAFRGEARAAIREMAAWLDRRGQHGCSLLLREAAGR